MFGVAAEFQDVPLRYAHVLQQPPRGVRLPFRLFAAQALGEVLHHLFKLQVRISTLQQIKKVLAHSRLVCVLLHDGSSIGSSWEADCGASAAVSGRSPLNTRPMPRTRRRMGSAPLSSAKKISPARLLR